LKIEKLIYKKQKRFNMQKIFSIFTIIFALLVIATSCNKSGDAPAVEGYEVYKDANSGLSLEYPKNWYTNTSPIRFVAFNVKEWQGRFGQYDTEGNPVIKLDVTIYEIDSTNTIDSIVVKSKKFAESAYETTDATIGGLPAKKLVYTFELTSGVFYGETYVLKVDDNSANVVQIECFDGTYDTYKEALDKFFASYKPGKFPKPKKDTVTQVQEGEPPSQTLVTKSGNGYSIKVPDNFMAERGPSGGVIESKNFIGERRADCNIIVDVIDASKNKKLGNIVEENRKNYKNANPSKISLGGKEAYQLNYTFGRDVMSRVYFVINGDKLFRITMNYYNGEKASYLPIFEKCISSFQFN
jgi:hypothetical protein